MFDIVVTAFSYERELIGLPTSALRISPRKKEVACNSSAMHILRFYIVWKIFMGSMYVYFD